MSKMAELEYENRLGADQPGEYELWGAVTGAPGGRWVVSPLNPATVWPVGTALYVCRKKE
jgi:hypothetical protein